MKDQSQETEHNGNLIKTNSDNIKLLNEKKADLSYELQNLRQTVNKLEQRKVPNTDNIERALRTKVDMYTFEEAISFLAAKQDLHTCIESVRSVQN